MELFGESSKMSGFKTDSGNYGLKNLIGEYIRERPAPKIIKMELTGEICKTLVFTSDNVGTYDLKGLIDADVRQTPPSKIIKMELPGESGKTLVFTTDNVGTYDLGSLLDEDVRVMPPPKRIKMELAGDSNKMPVFKTDCGRLPSKKIKMELTGESNKMPGFITDNVGKYDPKNLLDEDSCSLCRRDRGCMLVPCCQCPKVYHLQCHQLKFDIKPEWDSTENGWRCSDCMNGKQPKKEAMPMTNNHDNIELNKVNPKPFKKARNFVAECYKLPDIRALRWKFPEGYRMKFGEIPFNLKYIVSRLHMGKPMTFKGILELLLAFRMMFDQAFLYYKEEAKLLASLRHCYGKFLVLVEGFYPEHRKLFGDVPVELIEVE